MSVVDACRLVDNSSKSWCAVCRSSSRESRAQTIPSTARRGFGEGARPLPGRGEVDCDLSHAGASAIKCWRPAPNRRAW